MRDKPAYTVAMTKKKRYTNEKKRMAMVIKLKRYYGDNLVTKSEMEVWLEGEGEPRLRCEAREVRYKDYTETFPGASRYCLPRGKWRLTCGSTKFGTMTLRVAKCPGHRCVLLGYDVFRQAVQGLVCMGKAVNPEAPAEERLIDGGMEVYEELEKLVYEAWGKSENFSIEIENFCEVSVD